MTSKIINTDLNFNAIRITFFEKYTSFILPVILIFADYIALLVGEGVAFFLRDSIVPLFLSNFEMPDIYVYIVIPLIFLFFLHFDRMHIRRMPFWQMTEKLFKASTYAVLSIIVIMYFAGVTKEVSRIFIFLLWVFSFSSLAIVRYSLKKILNKLGLFQLPVILIGAGKTAELLLASFHQDAGLGYKVVGVIEDNPSASIKTRFPIIGTFVNAEDAIKRSGVKNVIIAAPGIGREKLLNLIHRLQPHVRKIAFVPDLFGVPVSSMELETLFNEKTVLLKVRNNLANIYNRLFKYSFDFLSSLVGFIVILPLVVLLVALIYIDSPGPVIFRHIRVGKDGKSFPCYKFRTMVPNAQDVLRSYLEANPEAREEWQRDFKLKKDPRITRVGCFLRKTSLDELPQVLNVLRGEMSLVGPRPIIREEVLRYGDYIHDYYMVRPGITGMWQVGGRNDIDYSERVKIDSWYVRNWSIWLDLVLLMKTVQVVLARKGAY
ncbi:exopolysaccharide biosynthesis protein [Sporomusaceae bacterium FL31]|nr:exopolysaccharide biosynthesis protein [Sporomusaceae bacterium FL31]GCE33912.1 exopolysaccharide biosynthesis protein [Sporomusaceae bacterium]